SREHDPRRRRACAGSAFAAIDKEKYRLAVPLLKEAMKVCQTGAPDLRGLLGGTLWMLGFAQLSDAEPSQYREIASELVDRLGKEKDVQVDGALTLIRLHAGGDPTSFSQYLKTAAERQKAGTAQPRDYRLAAHAHYRRKEYRACVEKLEMAVRRV